LYSGSLYNEQSYVNSNERHIICLLVKRAWLEDARLVGDNMAYTLEFHKVLREPKYQDLYDAANGMKVCRFVDKYVSRVYGARAVSAWLTKNKGKTFLDMITMSDIAYTVAVIENGHERWDESINGRSLQTLDEPRKTPKFTKKEGVKREVNSTGWNKEGIEFYNKVWEGWKKLSGKNHMGLWKKQVEDMWFEYLEEMGEWDNQGKKKKCKKTNSEDEDLNPLMSNLPPGEAAEMVLEGDEGYQPDCPWKYSAEDIDQVINTALEDEDLIRGWGENGRESCTVGILGVSIHPNRVSMGSNFSESDSV